MSERLRYLFRQYFNKAETPEERNELMRLIDRKDSEPLVHELMEEAYKTHLFDEDPFDSGTREKMLKTALDGYLDEYRDANVAPAGISRNRLIVYASAALLVLALSFGAYQFHLRSDRQSLAANKVHHDIMPGGNKAVLTLANGAKIELNGAKNGKLAQQGSAAVIKLSGGSLAYVPGASDTGESLNNTMSTPRGGQYKLQLQDGTLVMLNAESSITYPTAFTGNSRNVMITGEVYFEVAKNKKMPFIVSFGGQKVEVLGTHFDIRAYQDQVNKTTLLEGAVRISDGKQKKLLIPGQQAVYESSTQKFDIKTVDTDDVVAWKNGLFVFDGTELDLVMQDLARWYDIEVEYNGPKPRLNFTGLIKRDIPLSKVLKFLERTGGIKFTIVKNTVIVEKI
ncbi:FecR family protein [Mucilaginibacter sp. SJ]|uniref:FecR family protein n=1 Tax=Mucilaginibacter sp. SJ TaxID=3029053 RepID=UPI0023AA1098|nr:FecR family protein [Mucilaginibacter sp. SJ]WEA04028.1 FecR domain-containing protein [Mucilaginibacter sp. SJ]